MTSTVSNRDFSRAMINILKEICRDRGELRKALRKKYPDKDVLSDEGLRKRVERYIPKFEDLDLIELRGDKYCWKNDGLKEFGIRAMMLHSRKLIPALRLIARIGSPRYGSKYNTAKQEEYVSEEDMEILVSCAHSHLRSYPKTWNLLDDYKMADSKVTKMRDLFNIKVIEKLKKKFNGTPIIDPYKEGKHRSFIGSNIPHVINMRILLNYSAQIELEGEKILHERTPIAKGPHLLNRVREFVNCETNDPDNIEAVRRIWELFGGTSEIKQMIENEIRIIILQIDSGGQLLGGCEICMRDI